MSDKSPDMPAESGVEIVGPFTYRELVVDGWAVPFINAIEVDGGRVHFTVDHRLGFSVSAGDFEQVAHLIANVYAVAVGMSAWPAPDMPTSDRQRWFQYVQHPALIPARLIGITSVQTEEVEPEPSDDPRDEAA